MILSTLLTTSHSQDEVLAYPTAPVELIKKACDLTFANHSSFVYVFSWKLFSYDLS